MRELPGAKWALVCHQPAAGGLLQICPPSSDPSCRSKGPGPLIPGNSDALFPFIKEPQYSFTPNSVYLLTVVAESS